MSLHRSALFWFCGALILGAFACGSETTAESPPATGGSGGTGGLPADGSTDAADDGSAGSADDGGPSVPASVTNETWYQGDTQCEPPSITATSPSAGKILVTLLQLPAEDIPGSCAGHAAEAQIEGTRIVLTFSSTSGESSFFGACWTACWDFDVQLNDLPAGSYTVEFEELSASVAVQ